MENQNLIQVGADTITLNPDSLVIYQPRFTDGTRSRVKGIVRMLDGTFSEMESDRKDETSAFIRDVFRQYSEGEIEMFTHREFIVMDKLQELNKRTAEDKKRSAEREELFQAKAKAMAMPQIRDHHDNEVRRNIRRAGSTFEVMALTVAAINSAKVTTPVVENA